MPILDVINRERLPQEVVDELDQHIASLIGYLYVEHNDDGSHSAITVDSIDLRPSVVEDGEMGGYINLGRPAGSSEYRPYIIRVENDSVPRVTFGWVDRNDPEPFGSAIPTYLNGPTVIQQSLFVVNNGGGGTIHADGAIDTGDRFREPHYFAAGLGYWTPYTPVWTASTTNPTLGNGTLAGKYTVIGKTLHFQIRLNFGSMTNPGSGVWSFTLPLTVTNTGTIVPACGAGYVFDSGTAVLTGATVRLSATTVSLVTHNTANTLTSGSPIAWTTGDAAYFQGTLELP